MKREVLDGDGGIEVNARLPSRTGDGRLKVEIDVVLAIDGEDECRIAGAMQGEDARHGERAWRGKGRGELLNVSLPLIFVKHASVMEVSVSRQIGAFGRVVGEARGDEP